MKYKMLAVDIDRTMLKKDGTLTQKNIDAIRRATESGIMTIIVTGRSPLATIPIWEQLTLSECPSVCFGGSVIEDLKTRTEVYSEYIAPEHVNIVLDFAHEIGLHSQLYQGELFYYEKQNDRADVYSEKLKVKGIIDAEIRNKRWENVPKVLYFTKPENLEKHIDMARKHFGDRLTVSASTSEFIEINSPNADKGKSLERIAKQYGIATSEIVAVGDSLIDISMLETAGLGVAVDNSHPLTKAAADVIAPDCDDDAIDWVVDNLLF